MYTTKDDRRRAIATHDRSKRNSSGGSYATTRAKARPERRKNIERSYSRDNNTSWEYGYNLNRSGSTNRAPDPSMCVNHTMEFVNLDNYISNMFG